MAHPTTLGRIRIRLERKASHLEIKIEHDSFARKEWVWSAAGADITVDPVYHQPFTLTVSPGSPETLGVMAPLEALAGYAEDRELARVSGVERWKAERDDYDEEDDEPAPAPPPPTPGAEWMDDGRPASFGPRPIRRWPQAIPTVPTPSPPGPQGAPEPEDATTRASRPRRPRPRPPR